MLENNTNVSTVKPGAVPVGREGSQAVKKQNKKNNAY